MNYSRIMTKAWLKVVGDDYGPASSIPKPLPVFPVGEIWHRTKEPELKHLALTFMREINTCGWSSVKSFHHTGI
jgi:hypothetical protein